MIIPSIFARSDARLVIPELPCGEGYADLWFERRGFHDGRYGFLIEFKYLRKEDKGKFETVKQEGIALLTRYAQSDYFRNRKNYGSVLLIQYD